MELTKYLLFLPVFFLISCSNNESFKTVDECLDSNQTYTKEQCEKIIKDNENTALIIAIVSSF